MNSPGQAQTLSVFRTESDWMLLSVFIGLAFYWTCRYMDERNERMFQDARVRAASLNLQADESRQTASEIKDIMDQLSSTLMEQSGTPDQ